MSLLTFIKTGPLSWDFYNAERDEFIGALRFEKFDLEKRTCSMLWTNGDGDVYYEEFLEAWYFGVKFAIFDRKMFKVNASCPIDDRTSIRLFGDIGFLPGREYSEGKVRYRRYACDRYDLVRTMAEWAMGEHLDLNEWTFGWDSAKRRLGVCKYDQKLISLSRYFVDFHSEDEIDQVMRHEIAHALAGPKAGHGPKWKKIASEIGYKHEKISGDEIGNATAKLIGTCPNGHVVYRHRKPKTMLSCSKCATRFDKRFLITWSSR